MREGAIPAGNFEGVFLAGDSDPAPEGAARKWPRRAPEAGWCGSANLLSLLVLEQNLINRASLVNYGISQPPEGGADCLVRRSGSLSLHLSASLFLARARSLSHSHTLTSLSHKHTDHA